MEKRILVDSQSAQETRVVVIIDGVVEDFYIETQNDSSLKGNIYLAKVARIEPALQAAFVDYGGDQHGFLPFGEIHPNYFRIPVEDRQALYDEENLLEDDEEEVDTNGDEVEESQGDQEEPEFADGDEVEESQGDQEEPESADGDEVEESQGDQEEFESADGDEVEESQDGESKNGGRGRRDRYQRNPRRNNSKSRWSYRKSREASSRRMYRIQEVIKKNQIILVQVTKERRGNKGVSLSSYITLASRYCVFMANSTRGGGVSRKIGTQKMRSDLRGLLEEMEVPKGQALILRTAGAGRTKDEVRDDYHNILEVWNGIRNKTMEATAPSMIHEEASLAKRLVRDFYDEDVRELQISGDKFYKEVRDNMAKMLPAHKRRVKQFKENEPIFQAFGVEESLESAFSPRASLPSGGYIIIVQTEALVSIDVNSGRSTRERSIGDTAARTNLEAADEVARQLRLRDLAGLIVIDFIDMNNAHDKQAIEDRLRRAISLDRARIQIGSISTFGLLEMSRQRLRISLTELGTEKCKQCQGTGYVMSQPMISRKILRSLEGYLLNVGIEKLEQFEKPQEIAVKVPMGLSVSILNDYRRELTAIEDRYKVIIKVEEISTEESKANTIGDLFELEPSKSLPTIQAVSSTNRRPDNRNNRNRNKVPRDDKDNGNRRGSRSDTRGQENRRNRRPRGRSELEENAEQHMIEQDQKFNEINTAVAHVQDIPQDLSTQPQPDAEETLGKLAASRKGKGVDGTRTREKTRRPESFRGKNKLEEIESNSDVNAEAIVLDLSDLEKEYVAVEELGKKPAQKPRKKPAAKASKKVGEEVGEEVKRPVRKSRAKKKPDQVQDQIQE